MVSKELMSHILKEEVIYVACSDVEKMLDETLPTNEDINYMIPTKSRNKAKSCNISAATLASKCIEWAFVQGYTITLNIEESRDWRRPHQFRASITPTNYAEESCVSENSWDCVFGCIERIKNKIDEEIDDLFDRS